MKLTKVFSFSYLLAAGILFVASALTIAQEKKINEKDVPNAVLNSFHKAYPKAEIKGLSTEMEKGKKYYEIESVDGSIRRDLLFTPAGKIAEIEETIPSSELPNGSLKSIEKKNESEEINEGIIDKVKDFIKNIYNKFKSSFDKKIDDFDKSMNKYKSELKSLI